MEGWFTDPYERHQARWVSQGTPTSLVRDGNVQGSDPPAQGSFSVNPVIIEAAPPTRNGFGAASSIWASRQVSAGLRQALR